MLWNRRSDAWLGIGMSTGQRNAAIDALEAEGAVVRAEVEGIRSPMFFLAEDMPMMEAVREGVLDTKPRLEFLAPLDPMLWDRKLVEALWDYHYKWEIYTPVNQRKYGCYVLPILYGDRFVGRIESAADRKAATLVVRNIWYEDGVRQTKKLARAIEGACRRLAKLQYRKTCEIYEKLMEEVNRKYVLIHPDSVE